MTSLSNLTREQKIYLALWRKAYRTGEPIEVKLATFNQALSMRMAMYRAIHPYRSETSIDEELRLAGETFTLSVKKDSSLLTIQPRSSLAAAESAMADLGLSEEDLLSPEELAIQQRLEQEIDYLTEPADEEIANLTAPNPFFTRPSVKQT